MAAEESPTVHVPLLVQSSASSATSAMNLCCFECPDDYPSPAHQCQPSGQEYFPVSLERTMMALYFMVQSKETVRQSGGPGGS